MFRRKSGQFPRTLSSGQFHRPFPSRHPSSRRTGVPSFSPGLREATVLAGRGPLSGRPMADASRLAIPPSAATVTNRNGRTQLVTNGNSGGAEVGPPAVQAGPPLRCPGAEAAEPPPAAVVPTVSLNSPQPQSAASGSSRARARAVSRTRGSARDPGRCRRYQLRGRGAGGSGEKWSAAGGWT